MKQNGKPSLMLAILLAMATSPAHARYGFFAEAGGGVSRNDIFNDVPGAVDDDDMFFSIGGGYDFNKKLALEAGYIDLGEAEISRVAAYKATSSAEGFYFGPRLTFEFSPRVDAYGRIGMFAWDAEGKDNTGFSASVDGTDFYVGVGVAFRISDRGWLLADWTRYTMQGGYEVNANALGGKLKFNF